MSETRPCRCPSSDSSLTHFTNLLPTWKITPRIRGGSCLSSPCVRAPGVDRPGPGSGSPHPTCWNSTGSFDRGPISGSDGRWPLPCLDLARGRRGGEREASSCRVGIAARFMDVGLFRAAILPTKPNREAEMHHRDDDIWRRGIRRLCRLLHRRVQVQGVRIESIGGHHTLNLACERRFQTGRWAAFPTAHRPVWRARIDWPHGGSSQSDRDGAYRTLLMALAGAIGDFAVGSGLGMEVFASTAWVDVRTPGLHDSRGRSRASGSS